MIAVRPRPEPEAFDREVRQPGLAHREARPEGELTPTWRKAIPWLRRDYKGHCAYYGLFVGGATGQATVDHFVAKSVNPDLAYEWSNYRFACLRANARKGVREVVDPFEVVDGMFVLHPELMEVGALEPRGRDAIEVLGLNEPPCLEERLTFWKEYREGERTFPNLVRYAPFVALEMSRQGQLRAEDQAAWPPERVRGWLDE